jgi:hypothetical protein
MVFKKIGSWIHKNLRPSALLESKIVLYVLVIISILNLYTFAMDDNLVYAAIMIIVGFLSSFFNKNMIVILFTAIAVTNIINFVSKTKQQIEGFTTDITEFGNLMNHLTTESEESTGSNSETESPPVDLEKMDLDNVDLDKLVESGKTEFNTDPNVRDETIDNMVKKMNMKKLSTNIDNKFKIVKSDKFEQIKKQCNIALENTEKIANKDQRESVERFLKLQNRLLDQIMSFSPLLDEFREIADSFPN